MKTRPSILDAHATALADWDAQQLSLADMQARLKEQGVTVSLSRVSDYLSRQRSARLQTGLLQQIASGAQQVKEVEAQLAQNPAPELDTLIKLYRVLILKLSTMSQAEPALMELATGMTKQALDFEKVLLKRAELSLDRERLELVKRKADAYDRAQAALTAAKDSKGGITPETLKKIESELKLL